MAPGLDDDDLENDPDDPNVIVDPGVDACSQLDIVFAIDASVSMKPKIAALSNEVFPKLAEELDNLGGDIIEGYTIDDYRIGVLDACPSPAATLHTRGAAAECNFYGGMSWMDNASPNLVDEFICVTDLYTEDATCTGNDDDERPVYSTIKALNPDDAQNPGFLRDDALLVVVAFTDEDEEVDDRLPDNHEPQELYDKLVSLKSAADQLVFVAVGASKDCATNYGEGDDAKAYEAYNLMKLTDMFEADQRGFFWDMCNGEELQNGLSEAITAIRRGCGIIVD